MFLMIVWVAGNLLYHDAVDAHVSETPGEVEEV